MTITPPFLAAFPLVAAQAPAVTVLLIAAPAGVVGKVAGEVVNVDKSGQVIIATPKGEVIIRTDAMLQVGQTVEIKIPQQTGGPTTHNAVLQPMPAPPQTQEVAAPMPPALLLDIAEDVQNTGAPPSLASVLPGYKAAQSLSPAQTLLELVGKSLPATVLPQTVEEAAQPGSVPGARPLSMSGLEKVQIVFIGAMDDAQKALNSATQQALPGAAPRPMATPPVAGNYAPALQTPVLAQLIGLTPQKLPIFETLALPPGLKDMSGLLRPDGGAMTASIPKGAHIVIHAPVLMTAHDMAQQKPIMAMIATLPGAKPLPEALFALETLSSQAPLLAQLLRDPGSVLPPAMAAQMQQLVPRPGTPRFAMSVAMAMLGLSAPNPAEAMFGTKLLQALKAEQRAQLQKEITSLPTLVREGAQQNVDGLRFNLPVDMAGQLYLWQMTIRGHDQGNEGGRSGGRQDVPTRFILDLYMSRLGPMQMDGLSFPVTRRLDLILRSKDTFTAPVQDALRADARAIFERANLAGSIDFQTY